MSTSWLAAMLLLVGASGLVGCRQRLPVGTTETSAARVASAQHSSEDIRVLARARAETIATTRDSVLFGDAKKDALLAVPKRGGSPVFLGRHAPLDMSVFDSKVAWIDARGNAVYSAPLGRGEVNVLLKGGRFTALAGAERDLFVTKAAKDSHSLLRVKDGAVTSTVTLARRPTDVRLDGSDAYVLTDSALYGIPRDGGSPRSLVEGAELAGLALTEESVLTTTAGPPSRMLFRAPKSGARGDTLAWGVRKGPVAAWGGYAYYFDDESPTLFRVPVVGGTSVPIARDPSLGAVSALAVDESGIYLAVRRRGKGAEGRILAIDHPR